MTRPLAIDLYCGIGGWAEGLIDAGFDVIGFDNERHVYGHHRYPTQLVIQDVLTLHGSQFKDADLIVASPPCTEYSYMAMPWKRAKQIARALRGEDEFPDGYTGSRTIAELNALFDACSRIQREASETRGEHVPMVVENVRGAQPWVGRARWNYGSYYLWGDVPALMPIVTRAQKFNPDGTEHGQGSWFGIADSKNRGAQKNTGGSWFNVAHNTASGKGRNPDGRLGNNPRAALAGEGGQHIKQGGDWFNETGPGQLRSYSSRSPKRKMASALIAKIPFDLARHIGSVYARP